MARPTRALIDLAALRLVLPHVSILAVNAGEARQTFAALGLNAQHAYTLARNSFEASFIDASEKRRHIERLDTVLAHFME